MGDEQPPVAETRLHPIGPGRELSSERERRGLTAQQVAEQLNLDVSAIEAIEHDDFAALGAPVFARGHLRRYAVLLGLPAERLLAAYERAEPQPAQPTLIPRARGDVISDRRPARWPWAVGGLAAFLLAAALVSYVAEHGLRWPFARNAAVLQPSGTASPAASPAAPPKATGEGVLVAPRAGPIAATPAPATGQPVPPPGQVTLTFRFSGDSWIEVYDGSGRAVLYDLGSRGSERTITAAAPLSVTVGSAGLVAVLANGQALALPPPEEGQTLTRFGVGADGALSTAQVSTR